jgi:hypothetical protein
VTAALINLLVVAYVFLTATEVMTDTYRDATARASRLRTTRQCLAFLDRILDWLHWPVRDDAALELALRHHAIATATQK